MALVHRRHEQPLTEFLYRKAVHDKVPLSGTFELSPVCNLSCRMCYVRKSVQEVQNSQRPIMTKEEWLETARQMQKEGTLFLLLTGGEPLLWPGFFDLYEQLHEMGFQISINTNGTLIDEEAVRRFRKHAPVRLNITLYGASDDTYYRLCGVHGMYARVVRGIRMLKEAGIQVRINVSVTPLNAKDIDPILAFADSLDISAQASTYMFPPVRRSTYTCGHNDCRFTPEEAARYQMHIYAGQSDEKSYQTYLRQVLLGSGHPLGLEEDCIDPMDGKVRCRAGKASFWITWDGYMNMCGMVNSVHSDLRKLGFHQAWQEVVSLTQQMKLSGTCAHCSNQKICHSCAAMAAAETGKTEGIPSYLCRMVDEMKKIAAEQIQPAEENISTFSEEGSL